MVHAHAALPLPPPGRLVWRAVLVLTLGACRSPTSGPLPANSLFSSTTPGAGVGSTTDSGSPTPTPTDAPPPLWTAAAVGASLQNLLVDDIPNGEDFMSLFTELALSGDASCPGSDLAFTTPESSCTSSTGWEYFGFCDYIDQIEDTGDGPMRILGIVQASFVITAPDGRTLSAGGGFVHEQATDASGTWKQNFSGTFIWTGAGYPWLQAGTQVGWSLEGQHTPSGDTLRVHGPIGVGTSWAFIDTIDWDAARCGGTPEVALQVRDTEGRWYTWTSGTDCSPCGQVVHTDPTGAEHNVGELCLDLADSMQFLSDQNDFLAAE